MIAAILRAQWLSLRRAGAGRGGNAILSAIPLLFFYALWSLFAISAFFLCKELTDEGKLLPIVSGGLFGMFLYWQIAPVITASMGASLDLKKLIVYPINLDRLFMVEVLLRFFTVGEMMVVLAGATAGVASNSVFGGWLALPRILAAALAFVVFNLLIAAGVRSAVEGFFRRKRFRELTMFFFVFVAVIPPVLIATKLPIERVIPYLPLNVISPWGAPARIWVDRGTPLAAALQLGWIALAYLFGRRQFYRSLRLDPDADASSRGDRPASRGWADAFFRLPGRVWRDPLGAMVEKELRSLSRCSGFRLTFVMGFTFGLLVFLPQALSGVRSHSVMAEHFLAWVSMYSLILIGTYTFWNSFGYDRSAAQFYFAAPVSFRRVLLAKNITAGIVQTIEFGLISLVFVVFPLRLERFGFFEALGVTAVACLYLFAVGNYTSVRFATPMDPDKMSRGSSARGKNMITLLVMPIIFLPIGLAYWGRWALKSDTVFFLLLGLAAVIGGISYWIGTDSAIAVSIQRRDQVIADLTGGGGPFAAG